MSLLSVASVIIKRTAALRYPLQCKNCTTLNSNKRSLATLHNVNTKVINDVILFKYENPKFFRYMNVFAVVQYMFWSYLGVFAFSSLKDAPVDKSTITEETPWFRKINLGENKYRNTLSILAVVIGTGSLAMIWSYTLRSVRYLILNKGGKQLTFVTYTPFGKNRIMTVPLENICCKESRTAARVQLPLKVKNKSLHFILDMKGEFKNGTLFDVTAGLARKW